MSYITRTVFALLLSLFYSHAFAQNILINPGFEAPIQSRNGNNFPAASAVTGWSFGVGRGPNLVRVDGPGGYNYNFGGPGSDARNNGAGAGAGVFQQYIDINSGANSVYQSFTVPTCTTAPTARVRYSVSGWASRRDRSTGNVTLRIRNGNNLSGSVVGPNAGALLSQTVEAAASIDTWRQMRGDFDLVQGQTYTFEAQISNPANFDEAVVETNFLCPACR